MTQDEDTEKKLDYKAGDRLKCENCGRILTVRDKQPYWVRTLYGTHYVCAKCFHTLAHL